MISFYKKMNDKMDTRLLLMDDHNCPCILLLIIYRYSERDLFRNFSCESSKCRLIQLLFNANDRMHMQTVISLEPYLLLKMLAWCVVFCCKVCDSNVCDYNISACVSAVCPSVCCACVCDCVCVCLLKISILYAEGSGACVRTFYHPFLGGWFRGIILA